MPLQNFEFRSVQIEHFQQIVGFEIDSGQNRERFMTAPESGNGFCQSAVIAGFHEIFQISVLAVQMQIFHDECAVIVFQS